MQELIELIERFWKKTEIINECWSWCGAFQEKSRHGLVTINNRMYYIHRYIFCKLYKLDYDDKSFLVCHTCNIPHCWNLLHLYKGSNSSNMLDAVANKTHNESRKTHCSRGHEYTKENTRITNQNKRLCRICASLSDRRKYLKQKEYKTRMGA